MGKLKSVQDVQDAFDRLQKQMNETVNFTKSVYAEKGAARPKGLSERVAEGLGQVFKAVARGDHAEIRELGVQRGSVDYDVKSPLGSGELTGDATTGSYLIPTEYATEVLRLAEDQSELMAVVQRTGMTSRSKLFPKKLTGVSFTYVSSESTDKTESAPTFAQETLTARTYALWLSSSEEFLEDSVGEVGAYFAAIIGEAWATKFDNEFLVGSGTPVTGLLKDADTAKHTMTGTAFTDVTFDDLWDTISKLNTRAKRRGAKFILHPQIFDMLAKIKDAQGNYIYQRPYESRPGTLLGFPYLFSDEAPDLADSAKNTAFVALGNPLNLLWGQRLNLEIKFFPDTYYGMKSDQVFWRARVRAALNIALPENFAVLRTAAS